MSDYTPPVGQASTNYMSGWGTNSQTKSTAKDISHIADKSEFAVDMIENALIGFDAIEKELMELSSSSVPPTPEMLRIIAHRIDTNQKQVQKGLEKVKEFQKDIAKNSSVIQNPNAGWR
jgi:hypothetical protein